MSPPSNNPRTPFLLGRRGFLLSAAATGAVLPFAAEVSAAANPQP